MNVNCAEETGPTLPITPEKVSFPLASTIECPYVQPRALEFKDLLSLRSTPVFVAVTRAGFVSTAKIDDFKSLRHIRVVRRGPLDQDQVIPRNALRRHPLFRP